jgi:hypothetical protein
MIKCLNLLIFSRLAGHLQVQLAYLDNAQMVNCVLMAHLDPSNNDTRSLRRCLMSPRHRSMGLDLWGKPLNNLNRLPFQVPQVALKT